MQKEQAEVWLRGPVPEIPSLLQPVAHTLMQAYEEMAQLENSFPTHLLWEKPAGVAAVGFHLQHIAGILDRLFTYARGGSLTETQLDYLKGEAIPPAPAVSYKTLLHRVKDQLAIALEQIKSTDEQTLTEVRFVGRAMVPSTQIGLLFHTAEHTQRHVGQLLVTARFLQQAEEKH